MTELVIERLEAVDVAEHDAERLVQALGAGELRGEALLISTTVEQAGELIVGGRLLQPFDEQIGTQAQRGRHQADDHQRAGHHEPPAEAVGLAGAGQRHRGAADHDGEDREGDGGPALEQVPGLRAAPRVEQDERCVRRMAEDDDPGADGERPDHHHPGHHLGLQPGRHDDHEGAQQQRSAAEGDDRNAVIAVPDPGGQRGERERAGRQPLAAERAPLQRRRHLGREESLDRLLDAC
jgi:hypothetical protein